MDGALDGSRDDRRVTIGTFVANVMNRHPSLLGRMASTLQIASGGRLILGLGIGAKSGEHAAYGIDFPDVPDRVARVEEAVAVLRALWSGGPVSRDSPYYPLRDAVALPIPTPPPPIIMSSKTRTGTRLAGRIGDGWTADDTIFEHLLPIYLEALHESGRRREDQLVIVGAEGGDWLSDVSIVDSPWVREPRATWDRWREAGADGVAVLARSPRDVDALVDAVRRW